MFSGAQLWEAHRALRIVAHWSVHTSPDSLEHVANLANALAERTEDKPAAIFFAIGRYPRIFGDSWVDFARIYTGMVANHQGTRLFITRDTARNWLVGIASQKIIFSDLREGLGALMLRLPPSGS